MKSTPHLLGIPLELRQMIYSHLLDGAPTTQRTPSCGYDSYLLDGFLTKQGPRRDRAGVRRRFHTAILAANKLLHREAEQYLYRKHTFVLFTQDYESRGSNDSWINAWSFPVVAEGSPTSMDHSKVSLHIDVTHSSYASWKNGYGVLLLFTDLEALCSMLQWRFHHESYPAVFVLRRAANDPGQSQRRCVPQQRFLKPKLLVTTVHANSTAYRPLTPTFETAVTHKLARSLRGLCQDVRLQGFNMSLGAKYRLCQVMSPAVVDIVAFAWAFLEKTKEVKNLADRHLRAGHFHTALFLYQDLAKASQHEKVLMSKDLGIERSILCSEPVCGSYTKQIAILCMEAALTGGLLALRFARFQDAEDMCWLRWLVVEEWILGGSLIGAPSGPGFQYGQQGDPALRSAVPHLCVMAHMYHYDDAMRLAWLADHLWVLCIMYPYDEYIWHDYRVVVALLVGPCNMVSAEHIIALSSLCRLPPRCFDTPTPLNAAPDLAEDERGWTAKALTEQEWDEIHRLQEQHNIPGDKFRRVYSS